MSGKSAAQIKMDNASPLCENEAKKNSPSKKPSWGGDNYNQSLLSSDWAVEPWSPPILPSPHLGCES